MEDDERKQSRRNLRTFGLLALVALGFYVAYFFWVANHHG
jgi:hypothetical protein